MTHTTPSDRGPETPSRLSDTMSRGGPVPAGSAKREVTTVEGSGPETTKGEKWENGDKDRKPRQKKRWTGGGVILTPGFSFPEEKRENI